MFGLSSKGFKRKTYDEILTEMIETSREKFGNNINVSSRSLYGMFIRIIAWIIAGIWELAEKVYLSGYVRYAEGATLDRLASNIGLFRRGLQHSYGEVILYKDIEGAIEIPVGFIVRGVNNQDYITTESYIFPADADSLTILVQSVEKGEETNLDKLSIKEIVTPIDGIYKAQNERAIVGGADTETDDEFRSRYFESMAVTGSATRSALEGKLRALDGVKDAVVVENASNEYKDGIPPHSINAILVGGSAREIGYTILSNKAAGIGTKGEEMIELDDESGQTYKVYFDRPTTLEFDVKVNITPERGKLLTEKEEIEIERRIEKYINGLRIGQSGSTVDMYQLLEPNWPVAEMTVSDITEPIKHNELIRAKSVEVV